MNTAIMVFPGTTFNRPAFSELLKDIKSGKSNAVIVKDFSRLGRNYLEALELLDVVFLIRCSFHQHRRWI